MTRGPVMAWSIVVVAGPVVFVVAVVVGPAGADAVIPPAAMPVMAPMAVMTSSSVPVAAMAHAPFAVPALPDALTLLDLRTRLRGGDGGPALAVAAAIKPTI